MSLQADSPLLRWRSDHAGGLSDVRHQHDRDDNNNSSLVIPISANVDGSRSPTMGARAAAPLLLLSRLLSCGSQSATTEQYMPTDLALLVGLAGFEPATS